MDASEQLSKILKEHLDATVELAHAAAQQANANLEKQAALTLLIAKIEEMIRQMEACRAESKAALRAVEDRKWGVEKIWLPIIFLILAAVVQIIQNFAAIVATQRIIP